MIYPHRPDVLVPDPPKARELPLLASRVLYFPGTRHPVTNEPNVRAAVIVEGHADGTADLHVFPTANSAGPSFVQGCPHTSQAVTTITGLVAGWEYPA